MKKFIRYLNLREPIPIGRMKKRYHPVEVDERIQEICTQSENRLNLSTKSVALKVRQDIDYDRKISGKYVSKIMRKSGYVFKTIEKYRKIVPKKHRPEDIAGLGKRILKYLTGGGMVVWFDVTSVRIGGGCKRAWIHKSNLA